MPNDTGSKDDEIVKFTLRLTRKDLESLRMLAAKNHRSTNSQVIHMINEREASTADGIMTLK